MKIEIGKKYRLEHWEDGCFTIAIVIKGNQFCGEKESGKLCIHSMDYDWLPYTEPEPVKVWKTFAIEIEESGTTKRVLQQFLSIEEAYKDWSNCGFNVLAITEIKLNYTSL